MADLVALDLPLGPELVQQIRRAHELGRAVCVLDQRLSQSRQREIIAAMSPSIVVTSEGEETTLKNGHPVEPGDGLVVLSSGTSGTPKAAVLTWKAVMASAVLTSAELFRGTPATWFASLPPSHVGGFAVVARAIFTDDRLVFGDAANLDGGPATGATHVAVVRTQFTRFDLSGYQVVLLGGSRPPKELPNNVVTTWGMTETGSGVVYNRRPLPGVDVAIVEGEIYVRSPTLLRAYRDGSVPLRVGPDGRSGWLATGDAGELTGSELTVLGRLASVINTGGEKVWPEDLESLLHEVAGVSDVAVTGIDDEEWGQRVVAVVVSSRAAQDLLRDFGIIAEERLGPWAKPKAIKIVAAVARTANGKIRRDLLATAFQPTPPPG